MLKAGHTRINRYPLKDLEKITSGNGGNAYHSAEEWATDEEETRKANGKKQYKLVCVDKWWRGKNARRLLHKRIDPMVKRFQPKNNQLIPRHYDPRYIDNEGMPPEDCPHWFLSQEALNRLAIEKVEFDADFDTDEEDPREVRRARRKNQWSDTGHRATGDRGTTDTYEQWADDTEIPSIIKKGKYKSVKPSIEGSEVVDLTKPTIPDVVDLTKATMPEVTALNLPDIEQLFEMMSQRFFGKGFINPNEVHITPPFPNPFSLTNQPSSPTNEPFSPTNQPTQPPENQLVLRTQPTPNQSPESLSEFSEQHLPEFAQAPKLSSSKRPAKSQHNLSDSDKDSSKKKSDGSKKKKRR
jgi:hypothetical protein